MVFRSRGYTAKARSSGALAASANGGSSSSRSSRSSSNSRSSRKQRELAGQTTKRYSGGKLVSSFTGSRSPETFKGQTYSGDTSRESIRAGNRESIKANTEVPQIAGEQARTFGGGIQKRTERIQTERTYRAGNPNALTEQSQYKTRFIDKGTGQTFNKDNVPTQPTFIPIDEVTDDMLRDIGLSDFEINEVRSGNNPELEEAVELEISKANSKEQQNEERGITSESGPIDRFVGNVVNPILQKSLEFLGGEFKIDDKGRTQLTGKGVAGLAATAVTSGALGGAGAAYNISKLGATAAVSKYTIPQARGIAKVAKGLGISQRVVKQEVQRALLKKGIAEVVAGTTASKLAAGFTAKRVLGGAAAIASADLIFQWYALDNVIGGQKFFVRDIKNGVEDGSIDQKTAQAAIAESRNLREIAVNKVNTSASINPLMWPSKKLILAGTEGDQAAIRLLEGQIINFQQGESERRYGQ